jgi:hypothetical protein
MEGRTKIARHPAARTVIAPSHHFEIETPWNLKCYTLKGASMVFGGTLKNGLAVQGGLWGRKEKGTNTWESK